MNRAYSNYCTKSAAVYLAVLFFLNLLFLKSLTEGSLLVIVLFFIILILFTIIFLIAFGHYFDKLEEKMHPHISLNSLKNSLPIKTTNRTEEKEEKILDLLQKLQ